MSTFAIFAAYYGMIMSTMVLIGLFILASRLPESRNRRDHG